MEVPAAHMQRWARAWMIARLSSAVGAGSWQLCMPASDLLALHSKHQPYLTGSSSSSSTARPFSTSSSASRGVSGTGGFSPSSAPGLLLRHQHSSASEGDGGAAAAAAAEAGAGRRHVQLLLGLRQLGLKDAAALAVEKVGSKVT
jgi:hypothetical protein